MFRCTSKRAQTISVKIKFNTQGGGQAQANRIINGASFPREGGRTIIWAHMKYTRSTCITKLGSSSHFFRMFSPLVADVYKIRRSRSTCILVFAHQKNLRAYCSYFMSRIPQPMGSVFPIHFSDEMSNPPPMYLLGFLVFYKSRKWGPSDEDLLESKYFISFLPNFFSPLFFSTVFLCLFAYRISLRKAGSVEFI